MEGHADDEREIGKIHVVGRPALGKLKSARVLLGSPGTVWVAIKSVGVTQTKNRVDQHPGGDNRCQTHEKMKDEVRPLHAFIREKKEADRKQSGAGCEHDKDENHCPADILHLGAGTKFLQRRGHDGEPGQGKNGECEDVPGENALRGRRDPAAQAEPDNRGGKEGEDQPMPGILFSNPVHVFAVKREAVIAYRINLATKSALTEDAEIGMSEAADIRQHGRQIRGAHAKPARERRGKFVDRCRWNPAALAGIVGTIDRESRKCSE